MAGCHPSGPDLGLDRAERGHHRFRREHPARSCQPTYTYPYKNSSYSRTDFSIRAKPPEPYHPVWAYGHARAYGRPLPYPYRIGGAKQFKNTTGCANNTA